jgi:hypothetical protein
VRKEEEEWIGEEIQVTRKQIKQHEERKQTKDTSISSCQRGPTPSPGQVAHQGPSSTEVSSSHGGTQRNGDHCFLREEE